MKKKLFLSAMLFVVNMFLCLNAKADGVSLTIELSTPGTLMQEI